jgi:hypothetical protein
VEELEELALGLQADPRGGGRPAAPSRSSSWWRSSRSSPWCSSWWAPSRSSPWACRRILEELELVEELEELALVLALVGTLEELALVLELVEELEELALGLQADPRGARAGGHPRGLRLVGTLEELALGLQADPRGPGRPAAPSRSSSWWRSSRSSPRRGFAGAGFDSSPRHPSALIRDSGAPVPCGARARAFRDSTGRFPMRAARG